MKKILLILTIIGSSLYLINYFNSDETLQESNMNLEEDSIFLVGTWEPILHKNSLEENWSLVYNGYDLILNSDKTGYFYNPNWEDTKVDIEWSYFKFSQFSDDKGQMLDKLHINGPKEIFYIPYIDFINHFGGDENTNIFTVIDILGSGEQTIFHKMGTIPSKETYFNLTLGNQKVTPSKKVDQKKSNTSQKITTTKSNSWRQLKKGMTKQQVEKLLGEPKEVDVYKFIDETWWYEGSNHVKFDVDTGLVSGWSG